MTEREGEPVALAGLLAQAIALAEHRRLGRAEHATALRALAKRLAEARLQVAVLGQFKRGKSSLLNALVGHAVMPVDVLPATAIPVFIAGGDRLHIRITTHNGATEELRPEADAQLRAALAAGVTEEANPGNRLGIARVEVTLPASLLEYGAVLIDTPGVGSTHRHNTEAAEAALPECDAAILVVSPDPPITAVELSYLARIREAATSLILVFNKIDLLTPEERATSLRFLRRVLAEEAHLAELPPIFALSARAAQDPSRRAESGISALEHHLSDMLVRKKGDILHLAIAAKAASRVGAFRLETEIALRALRLPLEDLQRRIAVFDQTLADAARQQRDAEDRIAGEKRRMIEDLETRAASLELQARECLAGKEADALSAAANAFFTAAYEKVSRQTTDRTAEVSAAHWQRAATLADEVRRAAAEIMDLRCAPPAVSDAPIASQEPFWVTSGRIETLNELSFGFARRLLPPALRRHQEARRSAAERDRIVTRNVENLRWAGRQATEVTLRRLATDISAFLAGVREATRGVMARALERRRSHSEASAAEIAAHEAAVGSLNDLEMALRRVATHDHELSDGEQRMASCVMRS